MAAQQGFQYEINASNLLKKYGIVPKDFRPAGAGHDQPDLMIMKGNQKAGCEL
jgi:aminopeptidase C